MADEQQKAKIQELFKKLDSENNGNLDFYRAYFLIIRK